MIENLPPLSLYIHIPWCVRKCPYCDFNSHEPQAELPVKEYVYALKEDLLIDASLAQGRQISSIFFGGGTPSLFPGEAIGQIIDNANTIIGIENGAEITLEANPGTTECLSFSSLKSAGVNRLSMGVQSFNDQHLKKLGRIHNSSQAKIAFERAQNAGFSNINIDLMHGLPDQTLDDALLDLQQAINLSCTHISWYQLTIEPNTAFYNDSPVLPVEDTLADIQDEGHDILSSSGFQQYEVSAYALHTEDSGDLRSKHNLNYWRFGDYLGIGAGAHSKITLSPAFFQNDNANNTLLRSCDLTKQTNIMRHQKTRLPKDYLDTNKSFASKHSFIEKEALPLEFFMNTLRLTEGVEKELFERRTGQYIKHIDQELQKLQASGLLEEQSQRIVLSKIGQRYLNTALETFL